MPEGLVTTPSRFAVGVTIDRLVEAVTGLGLTVFARIDHGAGASTVDMPLRPTQLLIFGHPKGGTPLMQDRQTAGLDLPLRALAWEDESGAVWLTHDDPAWIAARHGLGQATQAAVEALGAGLRRVVAEAAGDQA